MKSIITLIIALILSATLSFADNTTDNQTNNQTSGSQLIKGLDNSLIQKDAKDSYNRDMKANYGNKETIVDKLLRPLTGAFGFTTPTGKTFDAKLTCTDNDSEEIAVITFFANNSYGQANFSIYSNFDKKTTDLYATYGQLLSGYFEAGIITCPANTWDDKCRYLKFSASAGTKQIFTEEINDKTEVKQSTCLSKACNREIDNNAINHITGMIIAAVNQVNLNGTTTVENIAAGKLSLKFNSVTDCTPSADNVSHISSLSATQRREVAEGTVAENIANPNSEFSLALSGYKAAIGTVPSVKSCTISNTPSYYLQCPEGYTRDYETKCSKSAKIRDIGSDNYSIDNDKTDFQVNRSIPHPNVTNNFSLTVKVNSPEYYGYDMDFSITLTGGGTTHYNRSSTVNIYNPTVQIADISLPYPTDAQNYSVTITAKPSDNSNRNFSFQVFESYEILSQDSSNFNITTNDGCKLYESCQITSEYICDVSGDNCLSSKDAAGRIQQHSADGITITADGKTFNFYDDAKKNYAKKDVANAWFNIQREYFCQGDPVNNDDTWRFNPSDLTSALGVVASSRFDNGTFSYTGMDGIMQSYTYTNEYGECTVPLCTVETSYTTTEAFTDGNLRDSGTPKDYLIKEVRSCDIEDSVPVCPRYPGDSEGTFKIIIPCSCSSTALMSNTAEALATINIINKVLENLTCSSQISK